MINNFNATKLKMYNTKYYKNVKVKGIKNLKYTQENNNNILKEDNKIKTFIPYLNERDNIGRLIKNKKLKNLNESNKLIINNNNLQKTERSQFIFEKKKNVVARNKEFIKLINSYNEKNLNESRNSFFFKNQGRDYKNNVLKEAIPCIGTYNPKFNLILPKARTHTIHTNKNFYNNSNNNKNKRLEFLNINEVYKKNNEKRNYLPDYKKYNLNKNNDKNSKKSSNYYYIYNDTETDFADNYKQKLTFNLDIIPQPENKEKIEEIIQTLKGKYKIKKFEDKIKE